jgi:hypothetical protein
MLLESGPLLSPSFIALMTTIADPRIALRQVRQ